MFEIIIKLFKKNPAPQRKGTVIFIETGLFAERQAKRFIFRIPKRSGYKLLGFWTRDVDMSLQMGQEMDVPIPKKPGIIWMRSTFFHAQTLGVEKIIDWKEI